MALLFVDRINELTDKVNEMTLFVQSASIDESKDQKEELEDLATEHLQKGLDSEGNDLGVYANIAYKGRLKPVDLKLTGAFYQGIEAKFKPLEFDIVGTDSKTGELKDKYGNAIIGLSNIGLQAHIDNILPELPERLLKFLRG